MPAASVVEIAARLGRHRSTAPASRRATGSPKRTHTWTATGRWRMGSRRMDGTARAGWRRPRCFRSRRRTVSVPGGAPIRPRGVRAAGADRSASATRRSSHEPTRRTAGVAAPPDGWPVAAGDGARGLAESLAARRSSRPAGRSHSTAGWRSPVSGRCREAPSIDMWLGRSAIPSPEGRGRERPRPHLVPAAPRLPHRRPAPRRRDRTPPTHERHPRQAPRLRRPG